MMRWLLLLAVFAPSAMAAELPQDITGRGNMRVAIIPTYPPLEFRDPATGALTGFDVDLGNALAARLGTKIAWQETSFDQMLASLQTGRVDAVLSGMSDLASRHDAAAYVDYLRTGPVFFVLASQAAAYKSIEDVCGKRVSAARTTSYPAQIAAWSQVHCGDHPIVFVGAESSPDARTQLRQGRADVAMQGDETLPYIMQQEPDTFAIIGGPLAVQYSGIALPKSAYGLQQAVADTLDGMITDGSYGALLAKWHLTADGIEKASINAGR